MENLLKKKDGFEGQKAIVLPRQILQNKCAGNPVIQGLYITDIGYYPKARFHYRERLSGADQHILIYCLEGSGQVRIGKINYTIEAGDFFAVPIKIPHQYAADENNPWTIYWLHFKGSTADAIIKALEKQTGLKSFLSNNEKTIELFNEMYTQLERGYGNDSLMYANMCLWHFLTTFLYNDQYSNKTLRREDVTNTAIDYLKNNIDKVLSLEDMAGQVRLSASHFSAVFKKKTGFSPIEYFNHLKVQKACQFLLFTNLRIKEIAHELGIEDQYYFSRMFTKVMGMAPNEYREKRIH